MKDYNIESYIKQFKAYSTNICEPSSSYTAYKDQSGYVAKTTQTDIYSIDKPPLELVVDFLNLSNKINETSFSTDHENILEEIVNTKKQFEVGKPVHLYYKSVRHVDFYGTVYKIQYWAYGPSAKGHALCLFVESNLGGFSHTTPYVYIKR